MAELQARNPANSSETKNSSVSQNFSNQDCHHNFAGPNMICNTSQNYGVQQSYSTHKFGGYQTPEKENQFTPQVSYSNVLVFQYPYLLLPHRYFASSFPY